jgi:IS30 family transposase
VIRSASGNPGGKSQGQIVDAISIRERPAEIEDRALPGHGEGDLLAGSKNTHIATLVERHSRFVMLIKVPRKDTTTVVAALSKHALKLPANLRRSLTWGPGPRDGQTQELHGGHECESLLLRSAESLATRRQ